jgi:hypothetical protein
MAISGSQPERVPDQARFGADKGAAGSTLRRPTDRPIRIRHPYPGARLEAETTLHCGFRLFDPSNRPNRWESKMRCHFSKCPECHLGRIENRRKCLRRRRLDGWTLRNPDFRPRG